VHGLGLDELTVAGQNHVTALSGNEIRSFVVEPEDAGLPRSPIEAIRGGDAATNAAALESVLQGAVGAYRDTVLLNAAAALIVAGKAGDLREGVLLAAGSIASGAALAALETLRRVSAVTES
jgi:anthranilate phosphoribosyltransferase